MKTRLNLLGRSFTPVLGIRHSESGQILDQVWNQHGLISREHRLTERDLRFALVAGRHSTSTVRTIRPVREWFLEFSVFITIETTILYPTVSIKIPTQSISSFRSKEKTTYHRHRVRVRSSLGVPLHRHLAGRTRIRAIIARST